MRVGADVEADDRRTRGFGERDVAFGDAASAGVHDTRAHLVVAELFERGIDRLDRALHITLDDQREFLQPARLQLRHHLLERASLAGVLGHRLFARQALTVLGDLARTCLVVDDGEGGFQAECILELSKGIWCARILWETGKRL